MLPVIALVGRPNVGKSTLFNALTGRRDAIVADLEGLTRDRRYGTARHGERSFLVVDTGGLVDASELDPIQQLTSGQAMAAIEEAGVLLFMVDGKTGLGSEDRRIAEDLRTRGKPVVVVVNKTDGRSPEVAAAEFHELGFEAVAPISAAHRRGLQGMLDQVIGYFPDPDDSAMLADSIPSGVRVAIVGRPNVGKSTLVNRLLGEERVVAFDQPGTTRDTIHVGWQHQGVDYVLMDTAGVRRRSRVHDAVEKFSVIKAMQAIDQADVVILMLDARDGVVDQDATLIGHVLEAGRALVVAVNKWDGLSRDERDDTRRSLDRKLNFATFAEVLFVSALHGSGLGELIDAVDRARQSAFVDISTPRLSKILEKAVEAHQPPMNQGRTAKLRYAHLGGHNPVRIVIHGNRSSTIPDSYKRYLVNRFREELQLTGAPLRLEFRDSDNPYKDRKNQLTQRQLQKRRRLKKFVKRNRRK